MIDGEIMFPSAFFGRKSTEECVQPGFHSLSLACHTESFQPRLLRYPCSSISSNILIQLELTRLWVNCFGRLEASRINPLGPCSSFGPIKHQLRS